MRCFKLCGRFHKQKGLPTGTVPGNIYLVAEAVVTLVCPRANIGVGKVAVNARPLALEFTNLESASVIVPNVCEISAVNPLIDDVVTPHDYHQQRLFVPPIAVLPPPGICYCYA